MGVETGGMRAQSLRSDSNKKMSKAETRARNEQQILLAAEKVFAQKGFKGASTGQIAQDANVPKANLHYYFPKKVDLYHRVIENICTTWLDSMPTFKVSDDPKEVLSNYIRAKMQLSRTRKYASKVFANEIISGAEEVQDYIQTRVASWIANMDKCFAYWQSEGRIAPVSTKTFFFMIWATTQHYADFEAQINLLNENQPLNDEQYEQSTEEVIQLLLRSLNIAD